MQSLLALTDTQISTWVASFILPLFRVTAMLMAMPVFGTTLVPRRVRERTIKKNITNHMPMLMYNNV